MPVMTENQMNPEDIAAAFRAKNSDALHRMTAETLKRGSIDDPKVLGALTKIAGTYSNELASYINGANAAPVVVSDTSSDQVQYTAPSRVNPTVFRSVAEDTFDASGRLAGSEVPAGVSNTPADIAARTESTSGLLAAAAAQSFEPTTVDVSRGATAPVYARDRRGNIKELVREGVPTSTETLQFGEGGGLLGRSIIRDESSLTPEDLARTRAAEAARITAEDRARETELRFAPGGIEDRRIGLLGQKIDKQQATALGNFIANAEKLLVNNGILDNKTKRISPQAIRLSTYDMLDSLAANYGVDPQEAYRYFGLPGRETTYYRTPVANPNNILPGDPRLGPGNLEPVSELPPAGIPQGSVRRTLRGGQQVWVDPQGNVYGE